MKVTRVYADAAGETHFKDIEIPVHDAGRIGRLSDPMSAKSVIFRTNDPDYHYDWHHAPARQFIVLLDGEIELEVSDGEIRRFGGGDILWMEDVEGKGHRTRHVNPSERRSLFIVLD